MGIMNHNVPNNEIHINLNHLLKKGKINRY